MTATETPRRCRACKQGDLLPTTWTRTFSPLGETVTVELLSSKCSHCGAESTSSRQHDENLERLAARKPAYGHLLMGEEIVAFRMKYGLTQRVAAKIFGKGLIAFSRYENEASYPDLTTTKLLRQAMANPELLKALADEEGVQIPLWEARCEEARREAALRMRPQHWALGPQLHWLDGLLKGEIQKPIGTPRGACEMVFSPHQTALRANNDALAEEAMAA
jgi:HTH-type transcriptional regulator/antitoxin MqsA